MSDTEKRLNHEAEGEGNIIAASQEEAPLKEDGNQSSSGGLDNRRILIWSVAGIYLVYLGIRLCSGFLRHEEGSAPLGLVFGLVFVVMGGYLVFRTMKEYSLSEKKKKESKPAVQAPKKKSIAERAHMTMSGETAAADAGNDNQQESAKASCCENEDNDKKDCDKEDCDKGNKGDLA